MLEMKFSYQDKKIVLINTHNSAFDKGDLKNKQMNYIKNKAIEEYKKGNYVAIGRDWNMLFPGVSFNQFDSKQGVPEWTKKIDSDLMSSKWQWVFDPNVPTARTADSCYQKGVNYRTIIDGFLLSPNIEVLKVKTDNLNFQFTDHNPVFLKLRLKT